MILLATITVPQSGSCAYEGSWLGGCASTDGTTVVVEGVQTQPGAPGTPRSPGTPGDVSEWLPGPPAPSGPDTGPTTIREECLDAPCVGSREFVPPPPDEPEDPAEAPIPDVTLADIASFTPHSPVFTAEPEGLGVAGLPTNLVASADAHALTGTLFERPVTIRFTPVGYSFTHGDGTTRTAPTGGATWGALGQAQFTPTPTSHVYAEPGDYAVTIAVAYTAVADFGTAIRPVNGTVTATTAPQTLRILEARTALVHHTCTQNPQAAGC